MEVIFNSDRIYFQVQGREQTYVFTARDDFRIDRQILERTHSLLQSLFLPFSFLILWPYYVLAKVVQVLFLVACGVTLRRPEWSRLHWRHWANIAAYGLTPAMLIGMIFQATTVRAEIAWFFYLGTAMLYTLMAARRCGMTLPPQ